MLLPRPNEIIYLSHEDFLRILFSVIEEHLNYDPNDPLPDYRKENSDNLDKILSFVRDDSLYETFTSKAAYLFVSITKGHIYSNGNKRLGLIATAYFLMINGYELDVEYGELYNLSLFVADRERNDDASFDLLKSRVEEFLAEHIVPSDK